MQNADRETKAVSEIAFEVTASLLFRGNDDGQHGLYAAIVVEGLIRKGDGVELLD
jgi:hypothetical protein